MSYVENPKTKGSGILCCIPQKGRCPNNCSDCFFQSGRREGFAKYYIKRKRTLNEYFAITTDAWESVMARYKYNRWVYSCGKVEGEKGGGGCRHCGNCLREFFATRERMETRS